jgi:hypothetical protein
MINRRVFGATLGLFGFGAFVKAEPPKTGKKGIIVCHCNVGAMPPFKAEAFMERIKDHLKKQLDKDFFDWALMIVPERDPNYEKGLYSFEYLPLNVSDDEKIDFQKISKYLKESQKTS